MFIHFSRALVSWWCGVSLTLRCLLLCLAGACTTLALAPFFITPILFVTLPLLMAVTRNGEHGKRAFWNGWFFGWGYFSAGLYWFAHALLVDAARFGWLIPFAVGGIGGALAIYIGLSSWLSYRIARDWSVAAFALMFALFWTGMEIARSYLFTGFPWNLIGYSWAVDEIPLQALSLGGIWWVSLLTMVLASMPLWFHDHRRLACLTLAAFVALLGWGSLRLEQHPTRSVEGVTLRLVQGAIPQELKWSPKKRREGIERYIELSRSPGYPSITHIIWPESAMTFRFREGDRWANRLAELAPKEGALLTGVVRSEFTMTPERVIEAWSQGRETQPAYRTPRPDALYNSLKAINAHGEVEAVYDKRKLVPFGEYIPFRSLVPLPKLTHGSMDFSAGDQVDALTVTGAPPFRPLICYEAIFSRLSERTYPAWLLNITNDGWFGMSTGPYQHFHMARARAVEQGVPLVRAANSGISAVIDPYGRVIARLGLGKQGVVDAPLPQPVTGEATIYARFGYTVLIATIGLLLTYVILSRIRYAP